MNARPISALPRMNPNPLARPTPFALSLSKCRRADRIAPQPVRTEVSKCLASRTTTGPLP